LIAKIVFLTRHFYCCKFRRRKKIKVLGGFMGFKIFASGITGANSKIFNYDKKNCVYLGDFTTPQLLSMIPAPTPMGVAEKVFDEGVGGWSAKGMFKIAEMEMAHMVATGVDLLAMEGRSGRINVYSEEDSWYWAKTNSFVEFYLNSSNPGKDFLKKISPGLEETGLNDFGALAQIAMCISKYLTKIKSSASPFLNISLSH
jgi:hypothetical protein